MFKIFSDCHIKIYQFLKQKAILKILVLLSEEPMFFLWTLKWNLCELAFSCVKTETNLHFTVKSVERSSHSVSVYLKTHLVQKSSVIQYNYKTFNSRILNCCCSFSLWLSLNQENSAHSSDFDTHISLHRWTCKYELN